MFDLTHSQEHSKKFWQVLDWYFPKGDLHEHLDSLAALQAWLDARHTAAPAETPGALAGAAGPALLKAKKLP